MLLFEGTNDRTVLPPVMTSVHEQLSEFVDADKLVDRFDTSAGHVWSVLATLKVLGHSPLRANSWPGAPLRAHTETLRRLEPTSCYYPVTGLWTAATAHAV